MAQDFHHWVSISVMPVDTRIASDGVVEYTDAPERSADPTPEQLCDVCWISLDEDSVKTMCPGPTIPDTLEGL